MTGPIRPASFLFPAMHNIDNETTPQQQRPRPYLAKYILTTLSFLKLPCQKHHFPRQAGDKHQNNSKQRLDLREKYQKFQALVFTLGFSWIHTTMFFSIFLMHLESCFNSSFVTLGKNAGTLTAPRDKFHLPFRSHRNLKILDKFKCCFGISHLHHAKPTHVSENNPTLLRDTPRERHRDVHPVCR